MTIVVSFYAGGMVAFFAFEFSIIFPGWSRDRCAEKPPMSWLLCYMAFRALAWPFWIASFLRGKHV